MIAEKKERLKKHKKNLHLEGNKVFSYNTLVALVLRPENILLIDPRYAKYSATTSRHLSYVSNELNLESEIAHDPLIWETAIVNR